MSQSSFVADISCLELKTAVLVYCGTDYLVAFFLFGVRTSDSQSGMRAFSRKAAQSLEINSNGMEVSSEILKEIKVKKLKMKEVPIKSIYTDYSLSKGQGFIPGIKTLIKILWSLFNF